MHTEWADWLDVRKSEFATYLFLKNDITRWGKVTSNAVENVNSSLLDIRNLPILYLIMGIIEKTQAKYLAGYRKSLDLMARSMSVTDYAYNYHKKLVKGAVRRKVFITKERETFFCGKVSTGNPNSQYPKYIEVNVEPENQESYCSCMLFQEEGIRCEHIIALLRKKELTLSGKWWFSERYHTHNYHQSYSGEVPTITFDKLQPDFFFTPPEYRKPAGRPARARKDRSHLNKTENLRQCSSCGGLGHSFRTCDRPSTQFRFENHYNKAVAWIKKFNEEQMV